MGSSLQPDHVRPTRDLDLLDKTWVKYESQIIKEDTLIDQRPTWLLLATTAFYAGFGVLTSVIFNREEFDVEAWLIAMGISLSGMWSAQAANRSIKAAVAQLDYIRKSYRNLQAQFEALSWPRPFGDYETHDDGTFAPQRLAQLVTLSWLVSASVLTIHVVCNTDINIDWDVVLQALRELIKPKS